MKTEHTTRRRPPESDQPRRQKPAAVPAPKPRRALPPERRRTPEKRPEAPEVIYEPAKPMTRRRFLMQLATAAAIVLALTFGLSIFFKVETITVSGANQYSAWTVTEASGIKKGDGLLSFGEAAACGRIKTVLPYVKNVRIGIKLPDTVHIEIEESAVTYAMQSEEGTWWRMTAEGRIIGQISEKESKIMPRIQGVELAVPVGDQAVASDGVIPSEPFNEPQILEDISRHRLELALEILQDLEKNEILGQVTVLDITNPAEITLQYENRYLVKLGDGKNLAEKIHAMHLAVGQMSRYQTGTLDVSFTTWPDQVAFTPAEKG